MFVEGVLEFRLESVLVINCGGVGYSVQTGAAAGMGLMPGEKVRIYTHMSVKEDGCSLFGFLTLEELTMFNKLISVSGVGPKAAQSLLAALPPAKLTLAILTDDVASLAKAQGVGKKTAARVVLELKDKLASSAQAEAYEAQGRISAENSRVMSSSEKQDAADALTALGYPRAEAMKVVLETAFEGMSAEDIIKAALRKLVK